MYKPILLIYLAVTTVQSQVLNNISTTEAAKKNVFDNILLVNTDLNASSSSHKVVEGDIIVEKGAPPRLSHGHNYNAVRDRYYLWRVRTIPYVIDGSLEDIATPMIEEAITQITQKSCLVFKKYSDEPNWIKFVKKPGCASTVGRSFWRTGSQDISLGSGCLSVGTILHEILHALGFWHEQSRPDRDDYVKIMWENIKPGEEKNFKKYDLHAVDLQGKQYDYHSIMHYGRKAYSKSPDLDTIVPIRNDGDPIGQRIHLSAGDIIELNLLYDCKHTKPIHELIKSKIAGDGDGDIQPTMQFYSDWTTFGPCNGHCYKERQRFCTQSDTKMCAGADFYGVNTESVKCSDAECYAPVDGHWGRWTEWSGCDVSCGRGVLYRMRSCDDPQPKYNGASCSGPEIDSKECNLHSCGLGHFDCQFDLDKCIWDARDGDFMWRRHQGPTRTRNTGPRGDHTTGDGFYIYTESSWPAQDGDMANITTNVHISPKPPGKCLSFWFHMYGKTTGILSAYVITDGGEEQLIWCKNGDQGTEWKNAKIDLKMTKNFKVRFSAVRGKNYFSDMALDDIFFTDGLCS